MGTADDGRGLLAGGFQAVVFDLFGTLVENFSRSGYQEVWAKAARVMGTSAEGVARVWMSTFPERTLHYPRRTDEDLELVCVHLGVQAEGQAFATVAQMRRDLSRRQMAPRDGALEVLTKLRAMNLKLGLISDCTAEVPQLWPESPFAPLFDVAVFSCVEGIKKPDPVIYHRACVRLRVAPGNCLYVGDGGSQELTGAQRAGLHPVLLAIPGEDNPDVVRFDAEQWTGTRVKALSEVLAHVSSREAEDSSGSGNA